MLGAHVHEYEWLSPMHSYELLDDPSKGSFVIGHAGNDFSFDTFEPTNVIFKEF